MYKILFSQRMLEWEMTSYIIWSFPFGNWDLQKSFVSCIITQKENSKFKISIQVVVHQILYFTLSHFKALIFSVIGTQKMKYFAY